MSHRYPKYRYDVIVQLVWYVNVKVLQSTTQLGSQRWVSGLRDCLKALGCVFKPLGIYHSTERDSAKGPK